MYDYRSTRFTSIDAHSAVPEQDPLMDGADDADEPAPVRSCLGAQNVVCTSCATLCVLATAMTCIRLLGAGKTPGNSTGNQTTL